MGCSRLSSTVTGIVYRGPFCSMFRTIRDPRLPRRFHAPSISPSSPCRPFYTSRRHGTRDIHRDNRGTKAKGNGTARFRIKLFSLSYPQRQPFCPANGIHRDAVATRRVGFRPRLSAVYPSLSLWLRKRQWKRGEGFEVVFVRGGVNRRRPFRCRCPLPFHASFRLGLIFSYFEIIMYGFLN